MVKVYGKFLRKLSKRLIVPMGVLVALTVISGVLFVKLPTAFLPSEDNGYFLASFTLPEGSVNVRTNQEVEKFLRFIAKQPGVQEEMGITGTTAKEAASTIEGSVNSAKAAWDNFLTGSITAEEFAESFSTAAFVILKNLAEIIPRLASTIPAIAVSLCQQLATAVQEGGSEMLSSAGTFMLNSLTNGIVVGIPSAFSTGK
mgnify:CR=1 FL=1